MSEAGKRDPRRQCSAPGCVTVLSIYNSDHLCFAHADLVTRARFERRLPADRPSPLYRQVIDLPSLEPAAGSST
ncbi:MAG TPA: hypothetical protein VIE12_04130 [Actinomycetota bacterium]|jgi:hypothetical protein